MHQLWKISVLNKNHWLLPGERTVINSCFPNRYGRVMSISQCQCICIVQYHRDDILEFYSNFFKKLCSLSNSIVFLFLFIAHLRRPSYLSLLFSGTLHFSAGYIFPFLPWLLLLFFPHIFVKSPQTTTLPSCVSFSLGWFQSLSPIQCYKSVHSSSGTLSTRSNPMNLSFPLYNHREFD